MTGPDPRGRRGHGGHDPGGPQTDLRHARYGRYRGGPDPLAPPVDLREALADIGEQVMAGTSPRRAVRELLRRGMRGTAGLDELRRRAARRRSELLDRGDLSGTLEEARSLLDEAVLEERKALARALDDDARFQEMQLAELPPSTAKAVEELGAYPWRSAEARDKYEQIKDLLGREMLDQRFAGMKQALENATDEDRRRVERMLEALSGLLDAHNRGEDTTARFAEFMDGYGDFFPEGPASVDELIDALAARAAAAQRLRNSLSEDQRAELDALARQAFGNPGIAEQLARLDGQLQAARPGAGWSGDEDFGGSEGMGLGEGTSAIQQIGDLEALSETLSQQYPGATMDDVDLDELARLLGGEAAVDARTLAELERALHEQGLVDRGPDGDLRLSPAAMRKLGQAALRDVARSLSSRAGGRETHRAGAAGEPTGAARPWRFGDTEPWDTTRTVVNAVLRTAGTGSGPPVRLRVDDVEVVENERRTRAAVALLVDISFSMVMDGRWVPMKRTALALEHLVRTRFRGDHLQIIAFGRHARTMSVQELAGLDEIFEQGTNLHHGLLLAGRHVRRYPDAQPVVLVVTDGEPTAHLQPGGDAFFDYPPHPVTLAHTVEELDALRRLGAQVTFFRLGGDPGLGRFVDTMARRVSGRVVAPDADGLGAAVVGDYLRARRRR
ncbi:vWA domain-containing protein [Tomitella cavernea]|uniref:VWA domain-containing protein n=1 Tax=Tomitella cavernea TaxID=1387982 RepID=A0ABP9CGR8_9ACTN|nr:VWA domain-containing protein [Tomitella cavernea]